MCQIRDMEVSPKSTRKVYSHRPRIKTIRVEFLRRYTPLVYCGTSSHIYYISNVPLYNIYVGNQVLVLPVPRSDYSISAKWITTNFLHHRPSISYTVATIRRYEFGYKTSVVEHAPSCPILFSLPMTLVILWLLSKNIIISFRVSGCKCTFEK